MQTCDKCGKSFELADEGELYAPDESEPCSPFMSLVELCGKCCEERDKEYELYGTSPVTITINGGDMIKRYDLVGEYDLSMGEITDGDYVLYSDHEQQLKEANDLVVIKTTTTNILHGVIKERDALLDELIDERNMVLGQLLWVSRGETIKPELWAKNFHHSLSHDVLTDKIKDRNKP